jgi:predicted transcriptional regulator
MQAVKQEALDAIAKLPDDTNMDEIMYRLYVLDKIRKGREAAEQGRTISHEDLKREIETW